MWDPSLIAALGKGLHQGNCRVHLSAKELQQEIRPIPKPKPLTQSVPESLSRPRIQQEIEAAGRLTEPIFGTPYSVGSFVPFGAEEALAACLDPGELRIPTPNEFINLLQIKQYIL